LKHNILYGLPNFIGSNMKSEMFKV
jgi:hypothetical protein